METVSEISQTQMKGLSLSPSLSPALTWDVMLEQQQSFCCCEGQAEHESPPGVTVAQ